MADLPAPKPFYRSRLFWLGMPGFVFLLWFELGFRGRVVDVGITAPRSYILTVVAGDRDLAAQYIDVSPIRHQGPHGWAWQFEQRSITGPYSGPVFKIIALPRNGEPNSATSYAFQARIWFLILLYLVAWFGILAAWQRRKTRHWKASAAGCAEPPARSSTLTPPLHSLMTAPSPAPSTCHPSKRASGPRTQR